MTKRKRYSEEEKAALRAVCKCGKLTQQGVDLYTKLFDFPPQPIKGIEPIDGTRHAPTILGLVALPAYKHWTLLDALNVVAMLELKWRDPITEPRNMAKGEVDAVIKEAQDVYNHFSLPPPTPAKLRAAMISRLCKFSPTKVDVEDYVRCDKTASGIGSESIDNTVAAQVRPGYDEKMADLNEANKKKRRDGNEGFRNKRNLSDREHRRRKSTYRQLDEMNVNLETGAEYMSDADLQLAVDFVCSVVLWPQLGERTVDQAMALPNFSQYTGITKQVPLSLEALNFLIRGVGRNKKAKEMVPPITRPDGSYINVPDAKDLGFFFFPVFRSTAMYDCKCFEEKMQKRYEHLPYISKILFKRSGSGANYVDSFSNHCCVYLSGIFDLQDLLDDGTVIVGDYTKSRSYYSYLL